MKMKTGVILLSLVVSLSLLSACGTIGQTDGTSTVGSSAATTDESAENASDSGSEAVRTGTADADSVEWTDTDLDSRWSAAASTAIIFSGSTAAVDGSGATAMGGLVTIGLPGTYVLSGELTDGQVLVDTEADGVVRLVLNGADITSSDSAPIYILKAKKVVLILADGSENSLTDSEGFTYSDAAEEEPNATLFSKSDLTINGSGSLTVTARFNDAIATKDELRIAGGTIRIQAAGDGIRGRDFIAVRDGDIVIEAGGDGMKSTNDEDGTKGFIAIEDGRFTITAGEDGIQAETLVWVGDGEYAITTGGGSANAVIQTSQGGWGIPGGQTSSTADDGSAKGIKAGVSLVIDGGTWTIDSSDDSLHSNSSLRINGGELVIASGDDGLHADARLEINGGSIDLAKSYEGIESSVIVLSAGTVRVAASDDGINGSGGADASSVNGRPGQNMFESSNASLEISGGYWYVDAGGDGIDINGTIAMTGGTVVVNGPTDNGNGPIDYIGSFDISGGLLVAAGSSGMAVAPSTTSAQCSVMVNLSGVQPAGTLFRIQEASSGEEILAFMPSKSYQSVLVAGPDLKQGETYQVLTGGTATGSEQDGLYSAPDCTAGTVVTELTLTGMVTTYGSGGMSGPGGAMPGGTPGRR
ncbi:MAG: carbohydrate-binding domain-containing protein [Clostridia bacterium]|nr:carbohydrate-binding domain-containing protein [Clostridia bacterium]